MITIIIIIIIIIILLLLLMIIIKLITIMLHNFYPHQSIPTSITNFYLPHHTTDKLTARLGYDAATFNNLRYSQH